MTAVCPQCASAKVDGGYVEIHNVLAHVDCLNCGWSGTREELLTINESEVPASIQQALDTAADVSSTYLRKLAESAAQPIGLAMVGAGVVGAKDTQSLTRLIKAACQGAHRATLDEIELIQKEYQDGRLTAKPGEA